MMEKDVFGRDRDIGLELEHEMTVGFLQVEERGLGAADAERLAPQLRALHEQILASGRPVEIRTFHAWFAQLLRAAPLELLSELGLQPEMELVEALDDHLPEIFRRFHAAVLRDPGLQADHRTLIADRGRSQARKWLLAALGQRVELELADAAGVLDDSVPPVDAPDPRAHPAQVLLGAPWQAALREAALALGLGGLKAQDAASGLVTALAQTDAELAFEHAWAALFSNKGAPRRQLGAPAAIGPLQDELLALARRIHQHDAHLEHRRMVRLSRVLLAEFAAYKRARGLADMQDLERCGLALLRDASLAGWVQERLDARIRHVLIDEFQDTSPLQWQALLAWLSAYAGAGGGASGQRPPGVFIVGDPKQSIYRFRRAEPRVFQAAQRFVVEALDGRMLACDHTRRNAPDVLAAMNAVFAQASLCGEYSGFRPHTTEVEARVGAGMGGEVRVLPRCLRLDKAVPAEDASVWRDSLAVPRRAVEVHQREREAAFVARAVRALIDEEGFAAADIMILSRKRESLRHVAEALRRRHVAFAAVEDFELMAAPEARDLVALLDVLASPHHRLSLAHALRSPVFGATDVDLIALSAAAGAGAGDWWRTLLGRSADGPAVASPALARAARLLREWQGAAARLPPHDLLDRIVHEGEMRERVAATVPPEQRRAALEAIDAVLAQALTLDGARYATPYNFVRALKRRSIRIPAPGQADAVRLLTVHGAKGLEARAVFVMDAEPEAKNAATTGLLVEWPVESEAPRRCAFLYSEAACPPALDAAMAEEVQARRREELNGLYVAMSRARERLVFSATEPHRADGVTWWHRILALATPWDPLGHAAAPAGLDRPVLLPTSPPLPGAPTSAVRPPAETDATRLGKAVHRLLEWATATPLAPGMATLAADLRAAARPHGAGQPVLHPLLRRCVAPVGGQRGARRRCRRAAPDRSAGVPRRGPGSGLVGARLQAQPCARRTRRLPRAAPALPARRAAGATRLAGALRVHHRRRRGRRDRLNRTLSARRTGTASPA